MSPEHSKNNFKIGSIIAVPKWPFLQHPGLVVGEDQVAHASGVFGKAKISSVKEFCGNYEPKFLRMSKDPYNDAARARRLVSEGYRYSVFSSNCEHFICACEGTEPTSPQLAGWIALGLLGVVVLAFRKSK